MQNDTSVEPWTNSTGPVLESPSMSLIILLSTLVLWIIFVNCLVLGCLLFSRHALKNFVNLQILSFSFTDILVGFSSILMIMTYPLTKAFPYFEACAAIFYSFGVSQSATLYHALGICIHRFVTIKRISGSNDINSRGMYKKILMQVLLTWIACIIITAIPFIVFGRFGEPLEECSLHHIFQNKYMAYIIFFNIFFITPQIGMTVIYINMFRFLIRKRKRINIIPVNTSYQNTASTSSRTCTTEKEHTMSPDVAHILSDCSSGTKSEIIKNKLRRRKENILNDAVKSNKIHLQSTDLNIRDYSSKSHGDTQSGMQLGEVSHSPVNRNNQTVLPSNIGQEFTVIHEKSKIDINAGDTFKGNNVYSLTNMETNSTKNKEKPIYRRARPLIQTAGVDVQQKKLFAKNRQKADERLDYKGQKDVLITIGLIILLLNIFMSPLNFVVFLELINGEYLSRKAKFGLMFMTLMNSGINPVIYAFRIKPFQKAVKHNWYRMIGRA